MMSSWMLADHLHEGVSLWEEYTSLLLDPAHFLAELTFTLLDILILTPLILLAWTFLKGFMARAIHREHLRIDQEHGHDHEASSRPSPPPQE